jgi:hypothetical protein
MEYYSSRKGKGRVNHEGVKWEFALAPISEIR